MRARIRAIQADLEAEAPHVSVARLQARIAAETRYQELLRLRDSAQVTVNDLLDVQQRSKLVKQELDGLGEEELTAQDAAKLNTWQRELQRLLSIFGFVVFAPREITVDPQGMRPAHGDSDLGFRVQPVMD